MVGLADQIERTDHQTEVRASHRRLPQWRRWDLAVLAVILLLSLGLHLYQIQDIGDGNTYYTAAVKSMLQSWHNFFFVAAEPGGSVTVDKPPLGFWIEAAFAAVLGVNGAAVSLPNILAGVASVWLLFHLVKKQFGPLSGLVAALVLAITPVSVAVDRNNTIDGLLIFTLLLAAWAFLRATESGRLRWLLLGAGLVGLGFNIKMMQAFLPLPAFYALYLFGGRPAVLEEGADLITGSAPGWRRRVFYLALASVVLAAVALSWAVVVDLVPANERPFVGSSTSNSEMELIFGYNGVQRLVGAMGGRPAGTTGAPSGGRQTGGLPGAQDGGQNPNSPGSGGNPPTGGQFQPNQPPGGAKNAPGGHEAIGQPGVLRFFQAPLAKEMSWLLPFGLAALLLAAFSGPIRLPLLNKEHQGLVLWGGWLVTCLVFFSAASFFHNYYLATLSPALGGLVGMGIYAIRRIQRRRARLAGAVMLACGAVTLAFQGYLVGQYGLSGGWVWGAAVLLGLAGLAWLTGWRSSGRQQGAALRAAFGLALLSMLVIPGVWTVRTVTEGDNVMLPEAYTGENSGGTGGAVFLTAPGGQPGGQGRIDAVMVDYLSAHTQDTKYLVAVESSHTGSSLVLETGRPVLLMGGFNGSDPVVTADDLARMVAAGELRFVLIGGGQNGPGGPSNASGSISSWLSSQCQVVSGLGQSPGFSPGALSGQSLYRCGSGS
jgi:4-amino-4-deoxy-L-arabinose transferase-like glycosyltransferase